MARKKQQDSKEGIRVPAIEAFQPLFPKDDEERKSLPPELRDSWGSVSPEFKEQWRSLSPKNKDQMRSILPELKEALWEEKLGKVNSWMQEISETVKYLKGKDRLNGFCQKMLDSAPPEKKDEVSLQVSKMKEGLGKITSEDADDVWASISSDMQIILDGFNDTKKREEGLYWVRYSLNLPKIIPGKSKPHKFQWLFEHWMRHYFIKVLGVTNKEDDVNLFFQRNYFQKRYDTTNRERMCVFQFVVQSRERLNDILWEIDNPEKLPGYDPKKSNVHVGNMISVGHAMLKIGTKYEDNIVSVLELMRCVEFANDRIKDLYPSDDHKEPRSQWIDYLRDYCIQAERAIAALAVKGFMPISINDLREELPKFQAFSFYERGDQLFYSDKRVDLSPQEINTLRALLKHAHGFIPNTVLPGNYQDKTIRGSLPVIVSNINKWLRKHRVKAKVVPGEKNGTPAYCLTDK
jgi:hypothetical protein